MLAGLDGAEREEALADFYARFADNPLVVDKWFTLQATSLRPNVLEEVEKLARHEAFTISNEDMGAMVSEVDLDGKSVDEVSDAWLAAHKDTWSAWIAE